VDVFSQSKGFTVNGEPLIYDPTTKVRRGDVDALVELVFCPALIIRKCCMFASSRKDYHDTCHIKIGLIRQSFQNVEFSTITKYNHQFIMS
jgi:hypothetical protein